MDSSYEGSEEIELFSMYVGSYMIKHESLE